MLNHNISEDSILAKNAIRDHILSDGLETQSVVILNELVWCIISDARQKCQNYLYYQYYTTSSSSTNSTLLKETNKITSKSNQLDKIHASLEADCVKFVEMAESKLDLSYISKANASRGKAVDVKNGIKEMTETLSMLQEN